MIFKKTNILIDSLPTILTKIKKLKNKTYDVKL
jgi:hypothetical protein